MKNEFKNSNKYGYNNKVEISNNIYMKNKWSSENINIMQLSDETQINNETIPSNNYIIKIFILILFPIIILSEIYYREKLYNYSIELGTKMQKYYSDIFIKFMTFITKFGCDYCCFIFLFIITILFSLIQTFVFFLGLIFCVYIQSLMKIIYKNTRPFMDNYILFKGSCDGGFGNPSGHSLISLFIYLSFFHYLIKIKYINENKLLKILLGILFSVLTILVLISRFILGLHSINQIIFGAFIGIWIFLFMFILFEFDNISLINYRNIFNNKKYILSMSLFLLLFLYFPFLFSNQFNKQIINYIDLNEKLNYNCSNVKNYKRFYNEGIFGCLVILVIFGFYYGQMIFWIIFDKYYKVNLNKNNNDYYLIDELINKWNKNKCLIFDKSENIFIFFKLILVCLSPFIIFFSINSDNVIIILLLKFGLPLFLLSFLFFSFGIYWLIIIYLGNKEKILNNYYQISINDI